MSIISQIAKLRSVTPPPEDCPIGRIKNECRPLFPTLGDLGRQGSCLQFIFLTFKRFFAFAVADFHKISILRFFSGLALSRILILQLIQL